MYKNIVSLSGVNKIVVNAKNNLQLHKNSKIILGIDPGTILMGYGVIEVSSKGVTLIMMDVLKLSSRKDAYERLQTIHEKVCTLVKDHAPHALAIEDYFWRSQLYLSMPDKRILIPV